MKLKKAITSFGFNSHREYLKISLPTIYRYAETFDYDVFIPSKAFFSQTSTERPPAWWKIEVIRKMFAHYDQVLWIDADVIVCDFTKDISSDLDVSSDMGLVIHETQEGFVPNTGVWILNRSSLRWFDDAWQHNNFRRSQTWWEQAAIMHLMGINPDSVPVSLPSEFGINFTALPYCWNVMGPDKRGLTSGTRFFHSTGFADRCAAMKEVARLLNL
jgi:hypothetical protein